MGINMAKNINRSILVQDIPITISTVEEIDYISLTDMVKGFDGGSELIKRWLQNRSTIEFLGVWEEINNPDFNLVEFHQIKNNVSSNSFIVSVKKWLETGAIGIKAKAGRYGGTYAHKDVAFEFGAWLSPAFKLYLIKEFQRLKEDENETSSIDWHIKRELAKVNYRLQTNAIQLNLLQGVNSNKHGFIYADEADLINVIVFGQTHQDWKRTNPDLNGNQRDNGTLLDNAVIANLEFQNSMPINQGIPQNLRAEQLKELEEILRTSMEKSPAMKNLGVKFDKLSISKNKNDE